MNMWQVSRCSLRLAGRKRAISGWTAGCCSIRRSTTIGYGTAFRIGPWARRPGPKRQERWGRPRTKGTIMADMHGEPTMEEILASIRRIIAEDPAPAVHGQTGRKSSAGRTPRLAKQEGEPAASASAQIVKAAGRESGCQTAYISGA